MVIHCHHSCNPISGEVKRIININTDVAGYLSDEVIEVEFYSIHNRQYVKKEGRFYLTDKIKKKYYVANVPRLGRINRWYRTIIIFFLMLWYKPSYYIEEWSLPNGFGIIKFLFKKCKIGLDIHGASPEEYEYIHKKKSSTLIAQERYSINKADFIICQSDEMKHHLERKYGTHIKIGVYTCGVNCNVFKWDKEERKEMRKKLGYNDNNIVFVYSGGMHAWQKVEDSVKVFINFHKTHKTARLLVLTKNQDEFFKILHKTENREITEDTIVKSLGYNEVSKYLNASDIAFLLRDNHTMNAVASPTKLSEYMACGLPVISSSVSSKWLNELGTRYIFNVDKHDLIDLPLFLKSLNRDETAKYAKNYLSLEKDRLHIYDFLNDIS